MTLNLFVDKLRVIANDDDEKIVALAQSPIINAQAVANLNIRVKTYREVIALSR